MPDWLGYGIGRPAKKRGGGGKGKRKRARPVTPEVADDEEEVEEEEEEEEEVVDAEALVGRQLVKEFDEGEFKGEVVKTWVSKAGTRFYSIVYEDGEQIHLYHRLNTKHMMAIVLWKNTKEYRRSLFWLASTQQSQSAEGGSECRTLPNLESASLASAAHPATRY